MDKKKLDRRFLAIPLALGGIFAFVNLLDSWSTLEFGVYDLFLHLKPAPVEDSSIVLLNVDEESIVRVGAWPWPRGLMAQGLEALAEFNAGYAVFDIEYLEKSPMSVDRTYLEGGLKTEFDGVFDEMGSNVGALFNAVASGAMSFTDAGEYGSQLVDLITEEKNQLYRKTSQVAVENDSYLGQAMRLFGRAYVTLNMQTDLVDSTPPELRKLAVDRFAYPKMYPARPITTNSRDFLVPIPEISAQAAGAGFTNVRIDADGVRRRIKLVDEIDGKGYLQLAFSPLIRKIGEPTIVVEPSRITLQGARLNGTLRDISIPVDKDGYMLIRWPKKEYADSFTPHVSFYRLLEYRDNEHELAANLRALGAMESWVLVEESNPVLTVLDAWNAAEQLRVQALESGATADRTAWLEAKAVYKDTRADFLATRWDTVMADLLAQVIAEAPPADKPLYTSFAERFAALYRNCAEISATLTQQEADLRARLTDAFCIIGWTATATTDMGANPFDEQYINVGTHAAAANTILQQDFTRELPRWWGSVLAVLLSLVIILGIERLSIVRQITLGLGATVLLFVVSFGLFFFAGIYVPTLAPLLATFFSFFSYALLSFIFSEREKSFLRKAFGTYLSGDVINEIVANPAMLKLGGAKKWMSAMFTDIRGFSTVSEQLDPEQLVRLLNKYLSGMSDILLENRGTIDKYEGDAIISFFGAPLPNDQHAYAACRAALLMKKRETEMNEEFLRDGLAPTPLLTRIGINTGDMVVGNMGTERKMDYTIMGNAVNLAARLEGVNKQYGSWILIADAVKREAGDSFIYRRFDRVRVVGINTPVQLWELVAVRAEADSATLEFLERFEQAKVAFDIQDWKKAAEAFGALVAERKTDGPSATYLKRSENFLKTPPAANWDGVFSLTEK